MSPYRNDPIIKKLLREIKIAFVILTVIFVAIILGFTWVYREQQDDAQKYVVLAIENQERIDDIQDARVASCQRTYEGIREVFKPFAPSPRTEEQQDNIDKFNLTIDKLKANCAIQTRVKEKGSPDG